MLDNSAAVVVTVTMATTSSVNGHSHGSIQSKPTIASPSIDAAGVEK